MKLAALTLGAYRLIIVTSFGVFPLSSVCLMKLSALTVGAYRLIIVTSFGVFSLSSV
jgi:hypothetical protein